MYIVYVKQLYTFSNIAQVGAKNDHIIFNVSIFRTTLASRATRIKKEQKTKEKNYNVNITRVNIISLPFNEIRPN